MNPEKTEQIASSQKTKVASLPSAPIMNGAEKEADGSRMRGRYDDKFQKELNHVRAELMGRMDALERHVQSEIDAMSDDINLIKSSYQRELEALRVSSSKFEREMRQAILDLSKNFSSEVHRVQDYLTAELAQEVSALENSKVARSSLAAMLSESVTKLSASLDGGGRIER